MSEQTPFRKSIWLWCPAYPLADAAAATSCVAVAKACADALGADLIVSPLLTTFTGPGAWLPAEARRADLLAGIAAVGPTGWLMAARGGYGCTDLVSTEVPQHLPRLIGYSDLTVLHADWHVRGAHGGLYGLMPGVRHGSRAFTSAVALARGEGMAIDSRTLPEVAALCPGTAAGPLFAGCLRVLAGLAGTPCMPRLHGHLLALEDIDERPYRIDRDLHQLHASGALAGIAGLIFGRFPVAVDPRYAGPTVTDIARAWASRLKVPAIFGLPIGHEADPLTVAQGRWTDLDVSAGDWQMTQAPSTFSP